jgi:hypothetical protein
MSRPEVTLSNALLQVTIAPEKTLVTFLAVQGLPGVGSGSYRFDQITASDIWTVVHNLGYYPKVQIFSGGGKETDAEVDQVSTAIFKVYFAGPFSGYALYG